MTVRLLHLADSHLGARHAGRPERDPFSRNLRRALTPARKGWIDLVLHAGDLFHRSRPPARIVSDAAVMLAEAADGGAHVVLIPGNHERSIHPCRLLLTHERVHFIDRPQCVRLDLGTDRVAIFGFPFLRRDPRGRFAETLAAAGWPERRADINILMCHQSVDGATVGPSDYTFRYGPDVIPRASIPAEFDYVALGHIHRQQLLPHPTNPDLPIAYPGSTERTSRAERFEEKGYLLGALRRGRPAELRFVRLPTEPMPETTYVWRIFPSKRSGSVR